MSYPSSSRILCEDMPQLPSLSPPPETLQLLSPIALSSQSHGRPYSDLTQYPTVTRMRIVEKYAEARAMMAAASIFEAQNQVLEELLIVTEPLWRPKKPKTIKKPRRGDDPGYPILVDDDRQMAIPSHPLPPRHIPPILCLETQEMQTNIHTIQEYRRWWEAVELSALHGQDLSASNNGTKKQRDQRIEVPVPGPYPRMR
jgi:hypothetical protein